MPRAFSETVSLRQPLCGEAPPNEDGGQVPSKQPGGRQHRGTIIAAGDSGRAPPQFPGTARALGRQGYLREVSVAQVAWVRGGQPGTAGAGAAVGLGGL